MCGIVTILTPDGKTVSSALLEKMTTRIAHRGPDDVGYACVDPRSGKSENWPRVIPARELTGAMFGHRRLSILDLSPGGHQPKFSDDGSMVLIFNGEIYNYIELRHELEQHGVVFRTRSDTEVLLKAYEYWGVGAFARFNGMWAFTLWDGRKRKLIACRDRFGVKPLYYAVVDGTWILASEIKALLAYPGAFRGFRDENIERFVLDNAVDGDDSTMFRDIWALSPGTYLELGSDGASHRRYWTLTVDGRHEGQSADALVERYRELLNDSVRLRVRSDVPIATMLSGGLDSTSITALICEQRAGRDGSDSGQAQSGLSSFHHTFTACWPGWRGSEEAEVDAFCENRGLESHKIYLTSAGMRDVIGKAVYHLDEPFANPTSLVQYLLMDQARAHGIKVVLNGHGSDEALGGYSRFVPPFLAQLLLSARPITFVKNYRLFRQNMPMTNRQIAERFIAGLGQRVGRDSATKRISAADAGEEGIRCVPYSRRAEDITGFDRLTPLGSDLWEVFATRTLPKWLRMEDRMSMAHSIESRLPFLDYRLVEMAFNLPDDMKLRNGYTKFVLREAMKGRLPTSIVEDRRKRRFSSPYGPWLRQDWRPLLEDSLGSKCRLQSHMDTVSLRTRLDQFLGGNGRALDEETIWRALSTELFLDTFSDAAGSSASARKD
jgi:asparagine synthase (glutamine-hydrolysing)